MASSRPTSAMTSYVATSGPLLDASDASYIVPELKKIATAISSIQAMVPQAATSAPTTPKDGMMRLARSPWRPVKGQTTDIWVYYDGSSGTWVALV